MRVPQKCGALFLLIYTRGGTLITAWRNPAPSFGFAGFPQASPVSSPIYGESRRFSSPCIGIYPDAIPPDCQPAGYGSRQGRRRYIQ